MHASGHPAIPYGDPCYHKTYLRRVLRDPLERITSLVHCHASWCIQSCMVPLSRLSWLFSHACTRCNGNRCLADCLSTMGICLQSHQATSVSRAIPSVYGVQLWHVGRHCYTRPLCSGCCKPLLFQARDLPSFGVRDHNATATAKLQRNINKTSTSSTRTDRGISTSCSGE